MLQVNQVESLVSLVSSLDRQNLKRQFLGLRSRFPIDFTPEFLDSLSVDRLRHIFVAICLQNESIPQIEIAPAPFA